MVATDASGASAASDATREDANTLAKGGALNMVGLFLYGILNFLLIYIVTHRLGPQGTGAFIEAIGLYTILSKSALLGADLGLLRYISRFRALHRSSDIGPTYRVALVPVAIIGTVVGVAVLLAAGPLGPLLSNHGPQADLTTYLRVMAPFIPVGAVYLALESGTRGFGTMVPSVLVERIGRATLQPVLMLAVTSLGLGSTAVALSFVGPTVVAFVPMALWTVTLIRRAQQAPAPTDAPGHHPLNRSELGAEFWRFSAPRALGGVFQITILWLDSLLVGALASTRAAGIYGAATRWLVIGSFAGLAITQAIGPQISFVLAKGEKSRAADLFKTSTGWLIGLSFPAYITVMVYASTLLQVFGHHNAFAGGYSTLMILGAANLFASSCGAVDTVLLMAGKSSLSLMDNALALAANIVLNLVLVPRWGISGAATAWAVSLVITNVLPLIQVWRATGLIPFGRSWIAAVGAAAVGVGGVQIAVHVLLGRGVISFLVALSASALAYAALAWRLRTTLELEDLAAALARRFAKQNPATHTVGIES